MIDARRIVVDIDAADCDVCEAEAPAVRIAYCCTLCRDTHNACVCSGCSTVLDCGTSHATPVGFLGELQAVAHRACGVVVHP